MPRKRYISVKAFDHERELKRADANVYDLNLSGYLVSVWRNWRSLNLRLQTIPPFPVDPWVPPSQRQKGGA
jgi:hypothetical protein